MRTRTRGIYLISAMLVTLLVVMFVGAGLMMGRGGTAASAQSRDGMLAELAADAGMQYCLARLSENPQWRGDANARVVDTPELIIEEDNGNVVGLIMDNGQVSQFRVRFNFQDDGSGNQDGLADPTMWVDHPYVSVNNLALASEAVVPMADGVNYSVTTTSAERTRTPNNTVSLAVEGRAGPAMRHLDGTDINGAPSGMLVHTTVLESTYVLGEFPQANSAIQAGLDVYGYIEAGGKMKVETGDANELARIRSKNDVTLENPGGTAATYESDDGEVVVKDPSGVLAADFDPTKVTVSETEQAADPFYQLEWDDVKKASGAAGDGTLQGGTYVFWDDGSLHYYDMTYDQYEQQVEAGTLTGPGTVVDSSTLPAGMALSGGKLTISQDVEVVGSSGNGITELAIIPRSGAQEVPDSAGGGGGPPLPLSSPPSAALAPAYYVGLADFSAGSPFHQMLMTLSPDHGSLSGGGGTVSWDNTGISVSGDMLGVTTHLFTGGTFTVSAPNSPNPDLVNHVGPAPTKYSLDLTNFDLWLVGGLPGDPEGEVDLTAIGATDTLTPKDLEVEFKPAKGESATLSASGHVRIGAAVTGSGGSITSDGNIRIVGAKTNLSANPNAGEGVNLYALGNIDIFSITPDGSNFKYEDFSLKGVVYTWGNFTAHLGYEAADVTGWGKLNVEGTLVAYGADASDPVNYRLENQDPGAGGRGQVSFTGKEFNVKYVPSYLGSMIMNLPPTALDKLYYGRIEI